MVRNGCLSARRSGTKSMLQRFVGSFGLGLDYDVSDGRACNSLASFLAVETPRSVDGRTAVGHEPDPACGAGGIDPWRVFDITRLA